MIRIPESSGYRLPPVDAELIETLCRELWHDVFNRLDALYGSETAAQAAKAAELAAMGALIEDSKVSL